MTNRISSDEKKSEQQSRILKGIPSSAGMAMGKAVIIQAETIIIPNKELNQEEIPRELDRFDSSVAEVIKEYELVISKVDQKQQNVIAVLETNVLILNDTFLINSIKEKIRLGLAAESAVISIFDSQMQTFLSAKDSMIRDRAHELDNIKERLIAALRYTCIFYAIEKGAIVIAKSVTPTDLVNFKEAGVAGIITEVGGITAHFSILARLFEIPMVIGVNNATQLIKSNTNIIINGYAGWALINPNKKSISNYELKKAIEEEHRARLGELKKLPSETKDGKKITLLANLDFPRDVESAIIVGAEGVGLGRSESLIMSLSHFPSEDEQYDWYSKIADSAYPYPVTIRAFDVGSDKYAEGMPKHESNPALGFRGIRFLLQRLDIYKSQIRAILRASRNKNIKLMLPMITNVNELKDSIKIIDECKAELSVNNIDFDKRLPVGIMIETPAAAIMADKLANYAKFFSIGTNDLTQYTVAADRTNELVLENFDSFNPAVLRLIKITVDAASNKGIPVSVCGEIAGHSAATSILIGMGIHELSVSPSILLELKNRIRESESTEAKKTCEKALDCDTSRQLHEMLAL
jgi:phosphoenolpyruvate-protein phosphotransferase (PTS system enzyme I)